MNASSSLAGFFLLTLCTVFVVSHDLANGIVSGKYFWFYGSMGVAAVATLLSVFFTKSRFRFTFLDLLILLFAGSVFLSALVFNDASQNTGKLTLFTLLLVLYFCMKTHAASPSAAFPHTASPSATFPHTETRHAASLQGVFGAFIVFTGLVEAVWGLLQLYGFETSQHNLFKLTGSFFNPGPYAGYLAVVFPMALHYCLVQAKKEEARSKVKKHIVQQVRYAVYGLTCILILLVLPAAMSRASWLAAIAGSIVVASRHFSFLTRPLSLKKSLVTCHSSLIKSLFTGIFVILLSAAFTCLYFLKKDSADGRLLTWKVSMQAVAQHPLGVGLGNFPAAYGEAQAAYIASGRASETEKYVAGNPEYGFNEYLQIAIESGIMALALFIGIIVIAIRSLVKDKNWGVLGSLVSLLVFACFSYPFSVLPFPILLVFLLASCRVSVRENAINGDAINGNGINGDAARRVSTRVFVGCGLFLITGFCLYKQYPVYQAYKTWNREMVYYHAGMYEDTAKDYEALYPFLNDQVQFLFEYAQSLSKADYQGMADNNVRSNEVLARAMQISCDPMLYNIMGKNYQSLKKYALAEEYLLKSTQIVPNRLYPWYLLCKLYAETEQQDKVDEMAAIVLTKEPKVQSPAIKEMREEVRKLKTKN
jgi:tetratricopeptide (TPR) repeat protein